MAIDDDQPEYDDQDRAEILDEDNLLPDSARQRGGDDGLTFEEMPDVYDATCARGDNDVDGDDEALDADEESDELLDTLRDEGDDEDNLDNDNPLDALDADRLTSATADVDYEVDLDEVDGVSALDPDEAELIDVADADALGGAAALSVADLESSGELSDEDLMELDYKDPKTGETRGGGTGDVERAGGGSGDVEHAGSTTSQARADEAPDSLSPGGDIHPDHPDHPERQDQRLDEALEETFPASDPVSAKHIT